METSNSTTADLRLSPHHETMLLDESAICEEIVRGRGYWTEDEPRKLKELGYSDSQHLLVPALVIPHYSLGRELANHQIRPDSPRLDEDGDPMKYELPAGSSNVIDCHPCNAERLRGTRASLCG